MTKAFDCAVRLLSRREHGACELSEKLKSKGFNPSEIEGALNSCQELGLQSDQRYVESYCRSRIRQGYGPLKISQELKTKHLDTALIAHTLNQEEKHWLDHALRIWQKKNKGQSQWSFEDLQKQQRFLLYRGFSSELIKRVMDALEIT